jgi:hypothetical protein
MDFKPVYAEAMREKAPKMWNRIVRSGELQAHLQEKSREAHALYRQLTGGKPASELTPSEERMAENQVFEAMLEFPDESPEPKDPLGRNVPQMADETETPPKA